MIPVTPVTLSIAGVVLILVGMAMEYFKSPGKVFDHYRRMIEHGDDWSWSELPTGLGVGCLVIAAFMLLGVVS